MSARRPWAKPLVPVYAAALGIKDALRRAAVTRTRKLQWPVLSVGSLSAGGAGKTPVVIALAKLLREGGWTTDVLSRGYGRKARGIALVQPGIDGAAHRFGDEPVLIARQTGAPVWVGVERFEAGERAEIAAEAAGPAKLRRVHLLDDGFQHRRLARTIDIVLVTAEDLDDTLLPAGNLRERLSALQRADVAVVREGEVDADSEPVGKRIWTLLQEGAQLWTIRRTLHFPAPLFVFGAGLRPVAFCAIARPEGFAAMLQEAGCGVVEAVAFGDHHAYTMADVERVIEVAKSLNGSGFVTTEKDVVKLTPAMRERMEQHGPLMVVALEAEFADAPAVLRALEAKLLAAEAQPR